MTQELKVTTINFKSLDQDIKDPIIAGAGDANGRTLRAIFTQEAASQFAPETKVYLSWHHQEKDIVGYNVFDQVSFDPPTWEIKWPKKMLFEGTVLCRIELVDHISVAPSNNFLVNVLSNPNEGTSFIESDDYSIFQQAIIEATTIAQQMTEQVKQQKLDLENLNINVNLALEKAQEALDKIDNMSNIPTPLQNIQFTKMI